MHRINLRFLRSSLLNEFINGDVDRISSRPQIWPHFVAPLSLVGPSLESKTRMIMRKEGERRGTGRTGVKTESLWGKGKSRKRPGWRKVWQYRARNFLV